MFEGEGRESHDVFISHASEDVGPARELAAELGASGYRCFVATDHLNALVGSQQWSEALDALLGSVPILVVLITDQALRSKWVQYEWRSFHDAVLSDFRAGLLVPILLEHRDPSTLPPGLRHWQFIDLASNERGESLGRLRQLLDGFRATTGASKLPRDRNLARQRDRGQPSNWRARRRRRTVARALGGSAVCLSLIVAALAWRHARRSGPSPRAGQAAPAPGIAARAPTSSPASSLLGPSGSQTGWEAIEAYVHPTQQNAHFRARAETWREAERAFLSSCGAGCTDRQRAAALFAGAERARLEGDSEVARNRFAQALETDKTWGLPLVGLAIVETAAERGREHARDAYAKDPSLWIALGVKGALFATEGNYVAAIQELMEERRLAPAECRSLIDAHLALAYHAEGLRDGKAERLASDGCSQRTRVASACALLAERALERREPNEALRYVERGDSDDFVPLVLAEGDALQLKGDLDGPGLLGGAWQPWRPRVRRKERQRSGSPRRSVP